MFKPVPSNAPIGHQMLGQVTCHDHAGPVVHTARHIKFTHCSIYKRDPRSTLFPRQDFRRFRIGGPGEFLPTIAPCGIKDMGRVVHQVIRKLAPDHFLKEMFRTLFAFIQRAHPRVPALMRADFPNGQVVRHQRGRVLAGKIAARFVVRDETIAEMGKSGLRGLLAHQQERPHNVCPSVHGLSHLPVIQIVTGWPTFRGGNFFGGRAGLIHMNVLHRVPERRVDFVKTACLSLYRPGLKHQMSTEGSCIHALPI